MVKKENKTYRFRWNGWTRFIFGLSVALIPAAALLDRDPLPVAICVVMSVFILLMFIGAYYKIEGDRLLVYTLFIPKGYPIRQIKEVKTIKRGPDIPIAPITGCLEVTFKDRNELDSMTPLTISPVRQEEFIKKLKYINPEIVTN